MNKPFDNSRGSAEDLVLFDALQDVAIPSGLESRLLAAVANEPTVSLQSDVTNESVKSSTKMYSRRAWLTSAAGLAGVSAIGGLAYSRREIDAIEVTEAVKDAWLAEIWSRDDWKHMADAPLTLPRELLRPRCWQYLETKLADETVTFDLTLPGRLRAVLFAATMWRDISDFPTTPPLTPKGQSGGRLNQIAIWRQGRVLYVLACEGSQLRDYQELFLGKGTASLA